MFVGLIKASTLITRKKFTHFWLPFTEALKIFGSISKYVLCHIESFTMNKNRLLENVKRICKFASSQSATVTHNLQLLTV